MDQPQSKQFTKGDEVIVKARVLDAPGADNKLRLNIPGAEIDGTNVLLSRDSVWPGDQLKGVAGSGDRNMQRGSPRG